MRLRGLMVMGALVMGVAGCGESVGPPEAEGRDLEIAMPIAKSRVDPSRQRSWDLPISEEDRRRLDAHLAMETGEVLPALLLSRQATAEWSQNSLTVSYGLFGAGTGYTMTPRVEVRERDGRLIESRTGMGRSEDQPLYWYMRPAMSESFVTVNPCGVTAYVNVTFEVRSTGFSIGEPKVYRNTDNVQTNALQPACTSPGGQSGGGGGGGWTYVNDGTKLWLCYYEVWMDLDGDVIDVFFFGCSEVGGQYLAE